jgi:type II secretory pathway component PulF
MAIDTRLKTASRKATSTREPWRLKQLFARRVGDKDRRFFTEQMALMLETGTPIQASLQALKKQIDNPAMVELIDTLIDDISQGVQFSKALGKHPQVFSQTYVNLVGASEDGGFMHEVLEQLLTLDDKREALRQTLVSALSYPAFLMVFALSVVIFVLVVVFPKFADLFAQIEDQLPPTTMFLMATSDILKQHWLPILLGLVALIAGVKLWSSTESGRYRLDWARLNLPLLRHIYAQMYLVNALRVLGMSLGNGVGMMDSLHATRYVVDNALFQRFIGRVEEQVENGNGLTAGFRNTRFIPPIVEQMIATGEETGNLPRVMQRLALYYETELTTRLKTLSRLAEPVMLLVMGGVVGVIVSSLILPIFKLSRAVG